MLKDRAAEEKAREAREAAYKAQREETRSRVLPYLRESEVWVCDSPVGGRYSFLRGKVAFLWANWDRRLDFRYTGDDLRKEARYRREEMDRKGLYPYEVIEEMPYTENGNLLIFEKRNATVAEGDSKSRPVIRDVKFEFNRKTTTIYSQGQNSSNATEIYVASCSREVCLPDLLPDVCPVVPAPGPMKVTTVCPNYASVFEYPREAMIDGVDGEVRIAFTVGVDGQVKDVRIKSSTNPIFERATLRAIQEKLRCTGQGREVPFELPVSFKR